MGALALEGFEDEIRLAVNREYDPIYLSRWANFGYLGLATMLDFEVLDIGFSINTVDGTRSYPFSPVTLGTFLGPKAMHNVNEGGGVEFCHKGEFYTYERTLGNPLRYTIDRANVLFHPTPSSVKSYELIYKTEPAVLLTGQATVLPAMWDQAIVYLGTAHAYAIVSEEDRASYWSQTALAYIQTRITEDSLEALGLVSYPDLDKLIGARGGV